jgi:hypothetical protein
VHHFGGQPMKSVLAAALILITCTAPATRAPSASPSPSLAPSMIPMALPIFDAHLHYSREAWGPYPPERMAELLNENGIRGALVSSAPDEGTFRLKAILADRIVPTLGPYRNGTDPVSWTRDPSVVPYFESAYRKGVHRGFGEIHLRPGEASLPVVKSALAFAARERLFLHIDARPQAFAELVEAAPSATILWAHAGVDATPEQVDAMLAKSATIWVELSFRDFEMHYHGELNPLWERVLRKYPDRFMVGTDTWLIGTGGVNDRLDSYAQVVSDIRAWLKLLPADLGEAIAHGNADRFFAQLSR